MSACPTCGWLPENGHRPGYLCAFVPPPSKPLVPLAVEVKAAQDAIKRADDHADEDWKLRAYAIGREVAFGCPEFWSDHLWAAGLEKPREARALGAVMQRLAKEGFIESTSRFVKTRQAGRHAADVRVWRSLVYRAAGAA